MKKAPLAGLLTSLALAAGPALAQDAYPSRPVRMIVPFTPGTGMDILARTLSPKLAERWKQPVVVENRPGASGNIGSEAVAKAAPDGYTLMMSANTLVVNRGLFKTLPYDPIKDFAPVTFTAWASLALVVNPSVKANTLQEFVALAKSQPGRIFYGSPGNGTPHHLAMELFRGRTGIEINHVPYRGSAQAVTDLLSGQVSAMFLPVHVALPQVEAGKLRMLASGSSRRAPVTPNVPTLQEGGVTGLEVDIWYALFAPAGTPADIVAKLNTDVAALLRDPEIRTQLSRQGMILESSTPAQLATLMKTDMDRWIKVVREANIQAD
jgi:tripartite-type tricarboxylate transporter receptor subunit TctC